MFLPHRISIISRTITIDNGETRYTDITTENVKAHVYKKEKSSLTEEWQARDTDETQEQVIIKKWLLVKEGDIIIPDKWNGPLGEYVVMTIDENYAYTKALQNTFFTIKKR